jgi:hypothetical protein
MAVFLDSTHILCAAALQPGPGTHDQCTIFTIDSTGVSANRRPDDHRPSSEQILGWDKEAIRQMTGTSSLRLDRALLLEVVNKGSVSSKNRVLAERAESMIMSGSMPSVLWSDGVITFQFEMETRTEDDGLYSRFHVTVPRKHIITLIEGGSVLQPLRLATPDARYGRFGRTHLTGHGGRTVTVLDDDGGSIRQVNSRDGTERGSRIVMRDYSPYASALAAGTPICGAFFACDTATTSLRGHEGRRTKAFASLLHLRDLYDPAQYPPPQAPAVKHEPDITSPLRHQTVSKRFNVGIDGWYEDTPAVAFDGKRLVTWEVGRPSCRSGYAI